ncbi:autotransporter [Vibrio lamellibrachiae]|uniref:autotransporter n=1 Tax=Vibrio lamellibrachiae TaxID=2910253 RepID=UPI003D0BD9B5
MKKPYLTLLIASLISLKVNAYEKAPFVAGGMSFIEDIEVLTVELGAEIAPNLNWSFGGSSTLSDSYSSNFASIYPTEVTAWGLHTAIGYEFSLNPTVAITPRIGLNYNSISIHQTDPTTHEVLLEARNDHLSPTVGLKVDIGRVGIISDVYKTEMPPLNQNGEELDETTVRIMAVYNF